MAPISFLSATHFLVAPSSALGSPTCHLLNLVPCRKCYRGAMRTQTCTEEVGPGWRGHDPEVFLSLPDSSLDLCAFLLPGCEQLSLCHASLLGASWPWTEMGAEINLSSLNLLVTDILPQQ